MTVRSEEDYKKWCKSTLADLRQMARQWDMLTKTRGMDEAAQTAYKDASLTLEAFIERAKWITARK